jgi:hypothetical protein
MQLKGTLTRDFRPLVFSSINLPWASVTRVKAFSNISSNLRKYSRKLIAQQWQWHHCAWHSGLNFVEYLREWSDTLFFKRKSVSAGHGTSVPLVPLGNAQLYHWHRCEIHSGANTMLWLSQRCQWQHCDFGPHIWEALATTTVTKIGEILVDFLCKFKAIFKKALTVYQGPRGSFLMKKTEVKNLVSGSL